MILKNLSAAALLVTSLTCLAQTPMRTNAQPERYLFVVDVSAPMRARAEATQKAVADLLASDLQGQLPEGAELGLWTFNNQLHTGEFQLVRWQKARRDAITQRISAFLKDRRYSGKTRFNRTLPELLKLVAESRRITILLFSDGDETFQGTPFDSAINSYFRNNAEAMKRDHVPFVTVLRGWHGKLIGHSITFPPWPVELPEFPPEPEIAKSENNAPVAKPKPAKRPVIIGEPLIVSGRKTISPKTEPVKPPPTAQATSAPPVIQAEPLVPTNPAAAVVPTAETHPPLVRKPAARAAPVDSRSNAVTKATAARPKAPPSGPKGESFWTPTKAAATGGGIVLLMAVVGVWWSRSSRRSSHTSLITRSMDHRRDKPR